MELLMVGLFPCAIIFTLTILLINLWLGLEIFKGMRFKIFCCLWLGFMLIAISLSFKYDLKILKWSLLTFIDGGFIAGIVAHRKFDEFRKAFVFWFKAFGILWLVYNVPCLIFLQNFFSELNWYFVVAIPLVSFVEMRLTA